jgi:hypothetical protein
VEGGELHSGSGYSFAERGSPFLPATPGKRWVLYSHDQTACLWSGGRDLLSVTTGGDLTVAGRLTVTGGSNLFKMTQQVLEVQQGNPFQYDLPAGAFTEVYGAVASIVGYEVNSWSGGGWGDRVQMSFGVQIDAVDTSRVHGTVDAGRESWATLKIAVTVFGRG